MEKKTEIYQLCPHGGQLMHSYLIKTPNGKIIMIDGGHNYYMEKAYLPHAIRAILGIEGDEYFEVEAWFFSHGHIDHYGEFTMMMKEYDINSNYKINNIYFDFPDFANCNFDESDYSLDNIELFKCALDKYATINKIKFKDRYYDIINGLVVNSETVKNGLSFTIDGVCLDILQTRDITDDMVNGNSTVIKVYNEDKNGKSCLFLNDASIGSGARLLRTRKEEIKSDIVQMAHHGQAGVDKDVYDAIGATIRLWPTPFWLWNDHKLYKIDEVRSWFGIEAENYTDNDIIAGRYGIYPDDYTSVIDWKKCVDKMKIEL